MKVLTLLITVVKIIWCLIVDGEDPHTNIQLFDHLDANITMKRQKILIAFACIFTIWGFLSTYFLWKYWVQPNEVLQRRVLERLNNIELMWMRIHGMIDVLEPEDRRIVLEELGDIANSIILNRMNIRDFIIGP